LPPAGLEPHGGAGTSRLSSTDILLVPPSTRGGLCLQGVASWSAFGRSPPAPDAGCLPPRRRRVASPPLAKPPFPLGGHPLVLQGRPLAMVSPLSTARSSLGAGHPVLRCSPLRRLFCVLLASPRTPFPCTNPRASLLSTFLIRIAHGGHRGRSLHSHQQSAAGDLVLFGAGVRLTSASQPFVDGSRDPCFYLRADGGLLFPNDFSVNLGLREPQLGRSSIPPELSLSLLLLHGYGIASFSRLRAPSPLLLFISWI